jgi:hypothetical protein
MQSVMCIVKEVISFTDEATGSEILVMPSDHFRLQRW